MPARLALRVLFALCAAAAEKGGLRARAARIDTPVTGVSGEVPTRIAQRLKKELPLAGTVMVTHCNARSGYLPDDDAYDQPTYEVTTSRARRGCWLPLIVAG